MNERFTVIVLSNGSDLPFNSIKEFYGSIKEFYGSIKEFYGSLLQFSSKVMESPKVDKALLRELSSMDFTVACATRALFFSGNSTLAAALEWIDRHVDDPDINVYPMVPVEALFVCPGRGCDRRFPTKDGRDSHVQACHSKGPRRVQA